VTRSDTAALLRKIKWLITNAERDTITLVYGAKNDKFNNAISLKVYMKMSLSD